MGLDDLLPFVKQAFQVCESPTTLLGSKTGILIARPMSLYANSYVTLKCKSPSFHTGTCLAQECFFHRRSADFSFHAFIPLPLPLL